MRLTTVACLALVGLAGVSAGGQTLSTPTITSSTSTLLAFRSGFRLSSAGGSPSTALAITIHCTSGGTDPCLGYGTLTVQGNWPLLSPAPAYYRLIRTGGSVPGCPLGTGGWDSVILSMPSTQSSTSITIDPGFAAKEKTPFPFTCRFFVMSIATTGYVYSDTATVTISYTNK